MTNVEHEAVQCPVCGGPGVELGALGKLEHFRCQSCGMQFSREAEPAPEAPPKRGFLGYACGLTADAQPTGVWHAVVSVPGGSPSRRAACSVRQRVSDARPAAPAGAKLCQRIGCENAHRAHERATP